MPKSLMLKDLCETLKIFYLPGAIENVFCFQEFMISIIFKLSPRGLHSQYGSFIIQGATFQYFICIFNDNENTISLDKEFSG